MTSFIWWRSPEEAYENPYEYEAQEQFAREAEIIVNELFEFLMKRNGMYLRDDCSSEKAVWMLFIDGIETIRDCLDLINSRKHRLASRLFRDVVETMDLATYFSSQDKNKEKHLNAWYDNEVVPNRVFRNYIANTAGKKLSIAYKDIYSNLSKLNHRTYRSLAYSYILRKRKFLAYEGEYQNSELLMLPHPIAMCYAILAEIITRYSDRLVECGLINIEEIKNIWNKALEKNSISRRFMTREDYRIMLQRIQENDESNNTDLRIEVEVHGEQYLFKIVIYRGGNSCLFSKVH
jgi:hypothetical protein